MNSSSSTLNPYADSYVPISRRELNEVNRTTIVPGGTPSVSDAQRTDVVNNNDKDSKTDLGKSPAVSVDYPNINGDYKLKGQQVDAAGGVSSEYSHETDSKLMDEDSEIDLAYLQMYFAGVSDQSIADVYHFNRGDLDSTMEMLTDLMSGDNLPHSLGIEQHEEAVSLGESSKVNAVNVKGESSSACPTVSAVAT